MDEVLIRKLRRQIRLLNFLLSFFGILVVAGFVVTGILLFKLLTFTHNATSKLDNLQQQASSSLNVKQQLCSNNSVSPLLKSESGLCN